MIEQVVLVGCTVQHEFLLLRCQVAIGYVGGDARLPRNVLHERPHQVAPGRHCPLVDGLALVGYERRLVDATHSPCASTGRTGSLAIEGERLGSRAIEACAACGTHQLLLERNRHARRHMVPVGAHVATESTEQQTQMIEQLGGRPKGRAHARDAWSLTQGKRRWHVQHLVHLGATRLADAPARIGGKALHVASAALGVEHTQRKRALARARNTCYAHKLSQGDAHVDVLQIVDTCAMHFDAGRLHARDLLSAHSHHLPLQL